MMDPEGGQPEAASFPSPAVAVARIRELLAAQAWSELARCYDLDGSEVQREELATGSYFHDPEAEVGHPFTRAWRHPFPPVFAYQDHEVHGPVAIVRVGATVDQGGGMTSHGETSFTLRRGSEGWRVLPHDTAEAALERARILEQVALCLQVLTGAGGHVASLQLQPESFEVLSRRPREDGTTAYTFRARGAVLTEFEGIAEPAEDGEEPPGGDPPGDRLPGIEPPEADAFEPVEGTIVLDEHLALTRDEEGRIRIEPYTPLHPRNWPRSLRARLPPDWPEHVAEEGLEELLDDLLEES